MPRDAKFDPLFEPLQIGPKVMKNRFYQVPHCLGAGSERPGTQAAYRATKAEGGWAVVCTEACSIDPETDTEPSTVARLWDQGDVINLRHMCDAVHAHGALAGAELWHCAQEAGNLDTRTAPMSEFTIEKGNLQRMMHEKGIHQYTNHRAESIKPGNITKVAAHSIWRDGYRRTAGPKSGETPRRAGEDVTMLECDTVILVTGRVANHELYGDLKSRRAEWQYEGIEGVFQIGDCYAPRMLADVIFDGHRLAREFETDDPQRPLPFIRERRIQGQPLMPTGD